MTMQQHLEPLFATVSERLQQPLLRAACLVLVSFPSLAAQFEPLDEPVAAPALSLPDIRGRTHDLAAYTDRVVLVNFWASWCAPCVLEMPELQRLARRFAGQPFSLLAVNVGERKSAIYKFMALVDLKATVLRDTDARTFKRWGATAYPTSYLIDRSGKLRFVAVGALDRDSENTAAIVDALLAEDTAAPLTITATSCYVAPSNKYPVSAP